MAGVSEATRRGRRRWDAATRAAFLGALAASGCVDQAARATGMEAGGAYRLRQRDARFRDEWAAALAHAMDRLAAVALRRAIEGVRKPVFHGGKLVGEVTDYSDRLLMFLLSRGQPTLFGRVQDEVGRSRSAEPGTAESALAEIEVELAAIQARQGG